MTNPNNNNDYSQFANFDPDLLVNESDKSESLSEPSNSDGSSGNDDGATPIWNRDKLAQLVEFEADESSAKAKSAVAVKSDSPETATPIEPDNIVSRDELFEEQDDPNLSKTERTFSNSPWTKGGLVGIGAMVVFVAAGLFLNNVFNRGKVAKIPPSSTPTPTLTPTPTPTENETGKLKTEIALGTQAEQLAALNRAKSPNNPTPTITPTPGIARTPNPNIPPAQRANSPSPPPRTVYRAPANTAASPPRVATREVVRRVRVPVQQPVPAQSTQVAGSPAPMTPKPVLARPALPPVDPLAQWQALARLGSYGQADLNTPDSDGSSVAAIPGQQAELAMPRPTSVPTATAYSSTPAPPAAPEAIAPAKPSSIASAEPSSIRPLQKLSKPL